MSAAAAAAVATATAACLHIRVVSCKARCNSAWCVSLIKNDAINLELCVPHGVAYYRTHELCMFASSKLKNNQSVGCAARIPAKPWVFIEPINQGVGEKYSFCTFSLFSLFFSLSLHLPRVGFGFFCCCLLYPIHIIVTLLPLCRLVGLTSFNHVRRRRSKIWALHLRTAMCHVRALPGSRSASSRYFSLVIEPVIFNRCTTFH